MEPEVETCFSKAWRSLKGTASHGMSARLLLKSCSSASVEANTISNGRFLPKNSWYFCSNL